MDIRTLTSTSIQELCACYNDAFSDYVLPFKLTESALQELMLVRRVRLELSVGAFIGNQLVGLILMGSDERDGKRISYNSGTGVIPAYRRNKVISKLYEAVIPVLRNEKMECNVLEVIMDNTKAFNLYAKVGYTVLRELHSFHGKMNEVEQKQRYDVVTLQKNDWENFKLFWDWNPSWQHDSSAVEKLGKNTVTIGIVDHSVLTGYLIYYPATKRVFQFAVHKNFRNKGVATELFRYISEQYSDDAGIINVDGGAKATIAFLEGLGLEGFVKQYEMILEL